jgi:3-isopropylmalate/(R)-2-methylmalate dehydratase large subunit
MTPGPRTAYEKILDLHTVAKEPDGASLVYIDRVMLHERTGSITLSSLSESNRKILSPGRAFCTYDHIIDTYIGRGEKTAMPGGEAFIQSLRAGAREFGLQTFEIDDPRQGIVHVISPELGIALPGITMVCADSHTCTLGGLGAVAWGIGSTDCEHALATGTLRVPPKRMMRVTVNGHLAKGVTAKDLAIHLISQYGASGGHGSVVEFTGQAITDLEVEARMTLCNMVVEFGAFTGFIAADNKTFEYVRGRPFAPKEDQIAAAEAHWRSLGSDADAAYDEEIVLDATDVSPSITWGTSPEHAIAVDDVTPDLTTARDDATAKAWTRAYEYMDLTPGMRLTTVPITGAFIGSCTNSRLSDLRRASDILKGRKVKDGVRAICVPGSTQVRLAAEREGLDRIFKQAGFEWREAGCSMCFYAGGESFDRDDRVISSTNRNFESRQGPGTKTHLASPETVALSAINGMISDVRSLAGNQEANL